jgi:uroporphyrinogen decarboxylase
MPTQLTHRQRILTTLAHREPDRVPMDLGGHGSTGIHWVAYKNLREHLGLAEKPVRIWHTMQQLADPDEDLLRISEASVRRLGRNDPRGWRLRVASEPDRMSFKDEFGITFAMPKGGLYYDPRGHPLEAAESVTEIERFPWPDPTDPARFAGIAERAADVRESTGCAVALNSICAGPLEMGQWLRGYDRFMMDLALDTGIAQAIVERVEALKISYWNAVLPLVRGLVDIVGESDDLGHQQGLLVSPQTYRKFLKPAHAKVAAAIRKHTDAPLYFHSCGAIRGILPDMIDCGIDIINPVQVSAAGMDSGGLKRDFGKDLVFWGGGCDTQRVLPGGSREEIRQEVKRRMDDLAPGGGFVFAPVHNIQADVRPESILALWEAWREFGRS